MTPREAAREFVEICGELTRRIEVVRAFNYDAVQAFQSIYSDDPLGHLGVLLFYTVGTPTLRRFLQEEDSKKYGHMVEEGGGVTPYSAWPKNLGIDLENGKYGVFDREGAKEYEQKQLLFWEPRRLAIFRPLVRQKWILPSFLGAVERFIREREERFACWKQEYQDLYDEPCDAGEFAEFLKAPEQGKV